MSDLDGNADATTTEVDSKVEVAEGAESSPAADETGKTAKPPHDADLQARFDKLTREKYEGLSRAERAEYRAQLAEQRLAEREEAEAKTQTVAPSNDYPTLESVGWDEAEHKAAVAKWVREQAKTEVKSVLSEERTAAQREQLARDWDRKTDDFTKAKPDFVEKVGSLPRYLMTDALADEIRETGNPEIAYYLAEHQDKLAEISRLPAKAMAREIGRIEARIEAQKAAPPPVSKAPPPPAKIDAVESVGSKDPSNMTDAQFAKWRKGQIAERGSR